MELTNLLLFSFASAALIIMPGPDILFVMVQGMAVGKHGGVASAIGLSLGVTVHTSAVALGLSVIFQSSPAAFLTLQYLGVTYLLFLAYQAYTSRHEYIMLNPQDRTLTSTKKIFVRGFLMNVLNPKVSLFFVAFLPQFVDMNNGDFKMQILVLGATFLLLTAIIFSIVGVGSGYIGKWIRNNPHFSQYFGIAAATVFFILALKLLLL